MKQQRVGRYRWIVLAMIFVVYTIAGADRANMGVIVPYMKSEFQLSNTEIGSLTSLFYLTYAAVQIPSGYLFGKFGTRSFFVGSVLLTSLATLATGAVSNSFQLKAARALLGFAEGPINIGIVSTINRWFPAQERGFAAGVFISAMKFAPAFVPPLCAFLVVTVGWRHVFTIFAIPGVLAALLWLCLVKDDPARAARVSREEADYIKGAAHHKTDGKQISAAGTAWFDRLIRAKPVEPMRTNREILRSWNLWGCAMGYFFIVGITYAIMTWVPTYLINVKHFSVMKVGAVASAPWIGAIFGSLLGGWLSDRAFRQRRKPVMMITSISTIAMMFALLCAPNDPLLLSGLFFLAGTMLNLGFSTFLVYPMGLVIKELVPFAASIVNTCGSVGGAFAPFVVGVILDKLNWNWVFGFLALLALLAFSLLCSIREPLAWTSSSPADQVIDRRRTVAA